MLCAVLWNFACGRYSPNNTRFLSRSSSSIWWLIDNDPHPINIDVIYPQSASIGWFIRLRRRPVNQPKPVPVVLQNCTFIVSTYFFFYYFFFYRKKSSNLQFFNSQGILFPSLILTSAPKIQYRPGSSKTSVYNVRTPQYMLIYERLRLILKMKI